VTQVDDQAFRTSGQDPAKVVSQRCFGERINLTNDKDGDDCRIADPRSPKTVPDQLPKLTASAGSGVLLAGWCDQSALMQFRSCMRSNSARDGQPLALIHPQSTR
jgi:hypothetical protein